MKKKISAEAMKAVEWIALNDEPEILDEEEIKEQMSVLMASDLYGIPSKELAKKICELRQNDRQGK